jgi:hypothetical protein
MVRTMRSLAVVIAALVFAPAASAWTTLTSGVDKSVVPSIIVTQAGSELVSWDSPVGGTISVSRNNGATKAVVTGDPSAGRTQLVQQPSGAIQLYFPSAQGAARMTSADDGQTWTGPIQTQSHTTGPVQAAAVAPDGTPYFAQDSTAGVNVFRGLDGESVKNVFPRCCAHAESLAVDTTGLVQVAFFSNADPDGTFLYEKLGADLSPADSTPLKPTETHFDRVPLVSDHSGTTFMAWPPGSPATGVTVVPFRGGSPAGDGVGFRGSFVGGDPHMALTVDTKDELWLVWTGGGAVHAARSRSHGQHFGASVSVPVTGTMYQVSAAAIAGNPGSVEVLVNTGSNLIQQALQPGLSVNVTRKVKKVGKKKIVTRFVQALDDGFSVPAAVFKIGGRTIHANSSGTAKVPAGSGKASASGYVGASFHVR